MASSVPALTALNRSKLPANAPAGKGSSSSSPPESCPTLAQKRSKAASPSVPASHTDWMRQRVAGPLKPAPPEPAPVQLAASALPTSTPASRNPRRLTGRGSLASRSTMGATIADAQYMKPTPRLTWVCLGPLSG